MSIDDTWLDTANSADLEALAQALLDGRIGPSFSRSSVQLAGFREEAARFLEGFEGVDPKTPAWILKRLAHERSRADDRFARVASLVWSGASEGDLGIRDTKVVLDALFGRAERYVLISTYVIYDGLRVFEQLIERLRLYSGISVELFVNLPPGSGREEDERADEEQFLEVFARKHWPSDVRLPAIYYDPGTRKQGEKRAALHAKCVVVDGRWAFVTSANFTEAAQERNIEAGVLLDHPKLSESLVGQFAALKASRRLKRIG